MSVLSSLFDVMRGGHDGEGGIDETFAQSASIAADAPLREGEIVSLDSDGTWIRADSVDLAAPGSVALLGAALASLPCMWIVISGAESAQYDGLKQGYASGQFTYVPYKVTAIRGDIVFRTARIVSRSYVPGDAISVDGGQLERTADYGTGYSRFATCLSYDSANGTLTAVTA